MLSTSKIHISHELPISRKEKHFFFPLQQFLTESARCKNFKGRINYMLLEVHTTFMRKDSLTNGTWPHSESTGKLSLRVAGEVLPQGPFVDVVLAAYRAGVVRRPSLRYIRINRFSLRWVR